MRYARAAAVVGLGVVLVVSMTGCANVAEQATKSAIENATGVKVDEKNGKTTVTTKDGQATLSSDQNKLPDGLPTYMPAYTGTVKASAAITTDKGSNFSFTIETGDDAQTILNWYKAQFAEKGWTVTTTAVNGDSGMVSAKKGETDNVVVTVGKNSEGKNEIGHILDVKKQ